jgi:hypothetical protein
MLSVSKEENLRVKRVFDVLGINYINAEDRKIIDYVSKQLKTFDTGAYVCFGSVSLADAIKDSLEHLKLIGEETYKSASAFVGTVPFAPVFPIRNGYSCFVSYSAEHDTMKVDKNSGKVVHYKVPMQPDVMASFHLGHEHIHALKETNYDEYIDSQILGDVIPIFYELLMADSYLELKSTIYKYRLLSLKNDMLHYDDAVRNMKKSRNDKDLYKVVATRSGQYLNSYYYATLLFNLYKKDSKNILELVNRVLKHEMTTREMLELLGLLHKDNNILFDSEFEEVKKCVKKV